MLWSQIFCKVYELRFVQQFYKSCVKCCRKKIRFVKTFVGLQLYHWKYSVSETLEEVYCFEKVYANKILKQAKLAIPKSINSLWSKKLVPCLSVRTLLLWLVCSVGKWLIINEVHMYPKVVCCGKKKKCVHSPLLGVVSGIFTNVKSSQVGSILYSVTNAGKLMGLPFNLLAFTLLRLQECEG